jgi:RimJ/RimL family protein N-acetyltransferase
VRAMEWTAELRDGTSARLRPVEPSDRETIERGFEGLSDESRYRRFLSPLPRLTATQLEYLTRVDHHDHEAILAISDQEEPMGVARYVRTDPDSDEAEVAVTVVDRWQGRGLGTVLLERLTERAREEGVHRYTATALASNDDMIDLLAHVGEAETRNASYGVVEMRVALPLETDEESPLRRLLRRAAAGNLFVRLLGREGRHDDA